MHPESTQAKGMSMGDDGPGGKGFGGVTNGKTNDISGAQENPGGTYGDQLDSNIGQNFRNDALSIDGPSKEFGMGATQ